MTANEKAVVNDIGEIKTIREGRISKNLTRVQYLLFECNTEFRLLLTQLNYLKHYIKNEGINPTSNLWLSDICSNLDTQLFSYDLALRGILGEILINEDLEEFGDWCYLD